MLTATLNRGFQMDFENGVSISVQWGHGNYCSNRDFKKGYLESMKEEHALGFKAQTAEILIEKDGEPITPEFADSIEARHDGRVVGWMNADQVGQAIEWARTYNKGGN